jgi:hypothetical protein
MAKVEIFSSFKYTYNHTNTLFLRVQCFDADPILKERIFGLTGPEGNHGEDPKELYFYLDSTPTHSYMKGLSFQSSIHFNILIQCLHLFVIYSSSHFYGITSHEKVHSEKYNYFVFLLFQPT